MGLDSMYNSNHVRKNKRYDYHVGTVSTVLLGDACRMAKHLSLKIFYFATRHFFDSMYNRA